MTAVAHDQPRTRFVLPNSVATAPPERRGTPRDGVRLLVARPGRIEHHRFRDLPEHLSPGDLLVVNTSATLPAAVDGRLRSGGLAPVHVSGVTQDGSWVVEVRRPDNSGPDLGVEPGTALDLPDKVRVTLVEAFPRGRRSRLWRARTEPPTAAPAYLSRHGQPIRYGYLHASFPLASYQNVYATEPGSAEMASAAAVS